DQLSSPVLAKVAGLSQPGLRALFHRELDCTPSQYLRWAAAFKAADLWQRGAKLTEIAHAAGFYDLAHADRVANELFGMNPSTIIDPRKTRLFRCAG
ncbi:MAG TPA: helix-turn-helix domain-containing protein, partial [Stenotrophobium sp.]|nr:helix-turn-helix domain-containing protein [Stenotrophobium sp.]